MSYDVSLEIDTGAGNTVDCASWNYTSNCSPMWREAGCDLGEFDGKPAPELAAALGPAIAEMVANPTKYKAMNPPNGWGDYDSCLDFLRNIRVGCLAHPNATVAVWR